MTQYLIEIDGGYTFENADILNGGLSIATAVNLPGAELSVDVFSATVSYVANDTLLWSPKDYDGIYTADGYMFGAETLSGDLTAIPYGAVVRFYKDGEFVGKFYIKGVKRIARTRYKISAMSAIGFLDGQKHMGGLYNNVSAADVLAEIIGNRFTYTVDPAVATQDVVGWLPIDSRRANLHQLMFALGFSLMKDANGDIAFVYLHEGNEKTVPDSRIFFGGEVDYTSPATAAEVTEHSFFASANDDTRTLFDNTDTAISVTNRLVEFTDPYHDLTADGNLTIDESGVNYAIVSGVGTLTGKRYSHTTRILRRENASAQGVDNTVESDECTLVNALNAENVAKRMLAYYGSRKTVKADIKLADEKSGDFINFNDAFGDASTGIIESMETAASSFLRGRCKIVTNYTPTGQGNYYGNRVLITASGTWTVPQGVTKIRIVLIGGGAGGNGGYDGEDGREDMQRIVYGYAYTNGQRTAKGGVGGAGGESGRIIISDFDIVSGEVITVSLGSGGTGGAANGGAGTDGTDSTASSTSIGTITTAAGSVTGGYVDPVSGDVYCLPGATGMSGGDGGMTDVQSLTGVNGVDGFPGGDVGSSTGGAGGHGIHGAFGPTPSGGFRYHYQLSGGGGGGAAFGANGNAGTSAYQGSQGVYDIYFFSGNGGDGADAAAPESATYGSGGNGGHGGGAGGNAAGCLFIEYSDSWSYNRGNGGQGGAGSAGADGGAGCAIIYY